MRPSSRRARRIPIARSDPSERPSRRRLLRTGSLIALVVVAVAVTGVAALQLRAAPPTTPALSLSSAPVSANPADRRAACLGAADVAAGTSCASVDLGTAIYPPQADALSDSALQYDCFTQTYAEVTSCSYGSREAGALRVAFVGDNRAASLLPGVLMQLPSANWALTTYIGDGCVLSSTAVTRCAGAQKAIIAAVTAKNRYDLVITAADRGDGLTVASYTTVFQKIRSAGAKLAVVQDIPLPSASALACASGTGLKPARRSCGFPRTTALLGVDPTVAAATAVGGVVVDLDRYFCTTASCYAVVGHVIVYRDSGADLTTTFSRTLGPYVVAQVRDKLKL